MTTELDDDLVPEIATLILDELGTTATFKVVTSGGVYGPGTSTASPEVMSDVAWKISPPQPYSLAMVDGDLIQMADLKTITSAQDIPFTPQKLQRVVFGGASWHIVTVGPIRSGDLVCAYELQLRRGPSA